MIRRLLRRRRADPAPISEGEAYRRSYGDRSGDVFHIERVAPPAPAAEPEELTGELLRRAFEARLDARVKRSVR